MESHERLVTVASRLRSQSGDTGREGVGCVGPTSTDHRRKETSMVTQSLSSARRPANVIVASVALSDIVTDDRAGSLAELVGQSINIYGVERFRSEQYDTSGFRLTLRVTVDGVETTDDLLYTGFSKAVMRVVSQLLNDDTAILRTFDTPIACHVVQLGNTYGIK